MVDRFCPRCGSKGKPFFKGFCVECYLTGHSLLKIPEHISVDVCPSCLRFRLRGAWTPSTLENASGFIESHVKLKQLEEPSVKATALKQLKDGALFELSVIGKLGGEQIELKREVELIYIAKQCLICARKQSKYYKALLQLRQKDASTEPKVLQSAFHFIRNENRRYSLNDREAEIFKFKKDKHGINVYLGSVRSASGIVGLLKSKFDADVKTSRTLVGFDKNGHKNFKTTFSIRL